MKYSTSLCCLVLFALTSRVFSDIPRFSCSAEKPSQEIDGTTPGEIVSPGYPGPYSISSDCSWKIEAPLGSVVRATITNLNMAENDYLTISDGETAFSGNLIGKYSLCMKGTLSLFSTGMYMFVQLKTDDKTNDTGFKITYKTVRKSQIDRDGKVESICSSHTSILGARSGYIAQPGFPNSVPGLRRCLWFISGPVGQHMHVSYKLLGLEKKTWGACDHDGVRHSLAAPRRSSKPFCECQTFPDNVASGDNTVYMLFASYRAVGQPGFIAYYKSLDPSTCSDPTSCDALNDDRDVGFDRRGNILFEKRAVTTPLPTTTSPPPKEPVKQFQVNCRSNEIEVVLNISEFSALKHDSATLLDSSCKARHANNTHIFIKTPLDGCGTTHNYSADGRYINYHNQIQILKVSSKENAVITRDHLAVFVFECKYHRKTVMSVVHFTPARAVVYTETEGFGNFTFMMKMFKTEDYKEAHHKYPVTVKASDKMFLQAEVAANDTDLVLLVDNCKVTPSKDPDDKEFYVILEEGCARDETLEYKHKLSPVQQFNFRAFYFESQRDASIHLHCLVRVCRKGDKNSRCVKGCRYERHKRAADEKDAEDISGTLTIGPVENGQQHQTGELSSADSRTMIVEIIVGVLGLCVTVLVVAVIIVLLKKGRHEKQHLSLMVEDNE